MIVLGLVLSMTLLVAGSAFARWGGYGHMDGYGMMGDYGSRYDRDVDVESVRKFQKDTLQLRDELITTRMELDREYSKAEPDTDRVGELRKGIIDIETKIQKVAEKSGLLTYQRGGNNRGNGGNRGCF